MKKMHLKMLVLLLGSALLVSACDSNSENQEEKPGPGVGTCEGDDCEDPEVCTPANCPNGTCMYGKCVEACTGSDCEKPETCTSANCPDGECVDGVCREICPNGRNEDGSCIVVSKCSAPDEDKDGISDEHEGRASNRDTDGDTVPDYLDDDSDGDTIPDSVEANNGGCSGTAPDDADYDLIPNYLDTDSDNNGILDSAEAGADPAKPVDSDGDTVPDYLDDDNDGDGLSDDLEIYGEAAFGLDVPEGKISADCDGDGAHDDAGSPEHPRDCDKDGVPDYMSVDSDGDTIPDQHEGQHRASQYLARYSKDSDENGIPDSVECHGTPDENGLMTVCVDTDGDTIPDYRSLDNDGDVLSDMYEKEIGTDPDNADTDGDGANDMVEIGAGTDPLDPNVNPQSRGDFVFTVPYGKKSTPDKQSLSFATSVQKVDIYFAVDTSMSMQDEIKTLQEYLPDMLEEMRCKELGKDCESNSDCLELNEGKALCSEQKRCIEDPHTVTAVNAEGEEEIVGCFTDMWTGFGVWGNLNSFKNKQSINEDTKATTDALGAVVFNAEGDDENTIQPPACVSEGVTFCTNTETIACYKGKEKRKGCVGYRKDAIKILVQAGDEQNKNDGLGFNVSDAGKVGESLRKNSIRYLGLYGSKDAYDHGMKQLACYAGSCPDSEDCAATYHDCTRMTAAENKALFLAAINNADIKEKTVENVRKLANKMKLKITSDVEDIDKDASKLVKALKVNITDEEVQGKPCSKVEGISGEPFESIAHLSPGLSVCFDVIPEDFQKVFPPTDKPQLKRARIKVMGDGSTLNTGVAYFLIPPGTQEVN